MEDNNFHKRLRIYEFDFKHQIGSIQLERFVLHDKIEMQNTPTLELISLHFPFAFTLMLYLEKLNIQRSLKRIRNSGSGTGENQQEIIQFSQGKS